MFAKVWGARGRGGGCEFERAGSKRSASCFPAPFAADTTTHKALTRTSPPRTSPFSLHSHTGLPRRAVLPSFHVWYLLVAKTKAHFINTMRCLASLLLLLLPVLLAQAQAQEHRGLTDINGTLVKCHTTAANGAAFILEIKREWAPLGAERFLQLVESGYFSKVPFFRVVPGFLTQFGIPPRSPIRKRWREEGSIPDDPTQNRPILRGYLSYAGGGPNTRDTQLFIALADSTWLGKAPWEVPLGRVIEGMDEVIDALYAGYGEISPFNKEGVDQGEIWEDDDYLSREFPKLDYFTDCAIIPASVKKAAAAVVEEKKEGKEEEKKQLETKKEVVKKDGAAADVRITEAASSESKATTEPVRSPGPPLGWWGILCVLGGVVGFLVMMWGLKDGKSMGKGK